MVLLRWSGGQGLQGYHQAVNGWNRGKRAELKRQTQLLCQMVEKGLSTSIMATKLNRTRNSVYSKIRKPKLKILSAVDEKNKKFFPQR